MENQFNLLTRLKNIHCQLWATRVNFRNHLWIQAHMDVHHYDFSASILTLPPCLGIFVMRRGRGDANTPTHMSPAGAVDGGL